MTRRVRVLLIRHGLTANVHDGGWIDVAGVRRWRERTDALGIAEHSRPPRDLVERVAKADLIVASDLPRAIESARRLAPGREIVIERLFRERDTELPSWLPLRWPLPVWRVYTASLLIYRIARGTDALPQDLEQAALAARWLGDVARDHSVIAVVFHRVFRRHLAKRLVTDGWTRDPGRHSYANWSAWGYSIEVKR